MMTKLMTKLVSWRSCETHLEHCAEWHQCRPAEGRRPPVFYRSSPPNEEPCCQMHRSSWCSIWTATWAAVHNVQHLVEYNANHIQWSEMNHSSNHPITRSITQLTSMQSTIHDNILACLGGSGDWDSAHQSGWSIGGAGFNSQVGR